MLTDQQLKEIQERRREIPDPAMVAKDIIFNSTDMEHMRVRIEAELRRAFTYVSALKAQQEKLKNLRDDIANRVVRYESERNRCESGGEAWFRIEAMRVTASNILFQFDLALSQARGEGREVDG